MERVSSPKIADENIFVRQPRDFGAQILSPMTESEFLSRRASGQIATEPYGSTKGTHDIGSAVDDNSDMWRPHVTEPHVSTAPADEVLIRPPKKRSLLNGKALVVVAMLGLATGIAFGVDWSGTRTLIESWNSKNARDALGAIFVDSWKGQRSVQAETAAADVTEISEIVHQLNAISSELSSVQQNIRDLVADQEQIRKAQEQIRTTQEQHLSETQSLLAALQTQISAEQNKQTAPDATERRKFNRR